MITGEEFSKMMLNSEIERERRAAEVQKEIENAPQFKPCEECGEPMEKQNFLAYARYSCKPCNEKREADKKRAEIIEQAEVREGTRIKYDMENIESINSFIPEMFHNVKPEKLPVVGDKNNILIFGNFGTGKTYSAYAHLKYFKMRYGRFYPTESYVRDGRIIQPKTNRTYTEPLCRRAFSIMKEIKDAISLNKSEDIFNKYAYSPLLIIDEYGKNYGSDYEDSMLFEIINTRYESMLKTVIIVNASEKSDLVKLVRPDILDRFRHGIVEINGKSRR